MQYFDETWAQIGAGDFGTYLGRMLAAQGEEVTMAANGLELHQKGWRLMRNVYLGHPQARYASLAAWSELWHGALLAHDRRLHLSLDFEGEHIQWRIS